MGKEKEPTLVRVKGKKVKSGKLQHLQVGKTYEVTEEKAAALVKNGQAEKSK